MNAASRKLIGFECDVHIEAFEHPDKFHDPKGAKTQALVEMHLAKLEGIEPQPPVKRTKKRAERKPKQDEASSGNGAEAPNGADAYDPLAQFSNAIERAGLVPPEAIIADGEIHRFSSDGRPGKNAGWYIYFSDDIPRGKFGCWRADIKEEWQADIGRRLTEGEAKAAKQRAAEALKKYKEEKKKVHAEARERAGRIWHSAAEVWMCNVVRSCAKSKKSTLHMRNYLILFKN